MIATLLLGRPVKWIEDRREHLMAAALPRGRGHGHRRRRRRRPVPRHARRLRRERGRVSRAGRPDAIVFSNMLFPGPVQDRDVRAAPAAPCTPTLTGRGAYRGPWMIETVVREQMVDRVAAHLGIDPLELRRRNVHPRRRPALRHGDGDGLRPDHRGGHARAGRRADRATTSSARSRRSGAPRAAWSASASACSAEPSAMAFGAMSSEATTVRVDVDGTVDVITSSISNGQSLETTLAQIVADELGVDFATVRVIQGDTDVNPPSGGLRRQPEPPSSPAAAARRRPQLVRGRIVAIAAQPLEAAPEDLEIVDGRVQVVGRPTATSRFREIAQTAYFSAGTRCRRARAWASRSWCATSPTASSRGRTPATSAWSRSTAPPARSRSCATW